MAKPRPPDALFADNPQLTRVIQDIYDKLTDDTVYDDADVVADIEANAEAIATKLQTHSYTELAQTISPGADATWTEVDLSSYGVQEGDMCDIEFRRTTTGQSNDVGCRTRGSSVNRLTTLAEAADHDQTTMRVMAGAGGVIELYEDDDSDITTTLFGFERFSTS